MARIDAALRRIRVTLVPHERTLRLFSPTTVGSIGVRNRVSLAP